MATTTDDKREDVNTQQKDNSPSSAGSKSGKKSEMPPKKQINQVYGRTFLRELLTETIIGKARLIR